MKCKRMQKVIITDYLDNELDMVTRQEIEQHLRQCQSCQKLLESVRATAQQPFKNQPQRTPPESVWHAIRSQIVPEHKQREPFFAHLRYGLQGILLHRRSVLAMATVMFAVVITFGIIKHPADQNSMLTAYFEEQAISYVDLQDNINGDGSTEMVDFGTALEEYFL